MNADKQDLRKYCKTKLRMNKTEGAKHEHFVPCLDGEEIELFHTIRLSRGRGASGRNNQKCIADALHMSLPELDSGVRCHIGPAAAYLGLCVQILSKVQLAIEIDPVVHRWDHTSLSIVPPLLRIAEREKHRKRGRNDGAFLEKLASDLAGLMSVAKGRFSEIANSTLDAIRCQIVL